jgi:N-hydroxyarylamine O-acetyltransferase
MIDLDAYFARIGYTGPRRPDLATLGAVHALHPAAIPFENLDPLLGRPVSLAPAALAAKLVAERRGGYCFEQNTLLKAALEALGFSVTVFAARVLWMLPADRPPNPRAHMVLKVEGEKVAHIADVGFGGLLSAAPVPLPGAAPGAAGAEQPVPGGALRLIRMGMFLHLQARTDGLWRDVYSFTEEPQFPIDVEIANWFTSAHPGSRFRNVLMVQKLLPDARVSLMNRRLVRRPAEGQAQERMIEDAAALENVLRESFGIDPPGDLSEVFARLPTT